MVNRSIICHTDDEYLWESYGILLFKISVIHLLNCTEKSQETINEIDRALSFLPSYE